MRPIQSGLVCRADLFIALVALAFPGGATAVEPAGPEGASGELSQLIRDAKDDFRPPSDGKLALAKTAAIAAKDELVDYLANLPTGQSARAEYGVEALAAELGRAAPRLAPLESALWALERNRPGVKDAGLVRLQAALGRYLELLRCGAGPAVRDQYARQLEKLASAWESYSSRRSPESFREIRAAYDWLSDRGQAGELVQRIEHEASRFNHRMRVSGKFIEESLTREVRQPLATSESSSGTRIRVRGEVQGTIHASLEPHERMGGLRIDFRGVGNSRITAERGPATVWARARTEISASEVVYLSEKGIRTSPPQVWVRNSTTPYAVDVDLRCRLLRKMATPLVWRIAWRQKAKGDRQGAARARQQLDRELRTQSDELVEQTNQVIDQFSLLDLLGPDPAARLRITTTQSHLEWMARYAPRRQFGAPTDPPDLPGIDPAVLLQIHESALNNAGPLLAGRAVSEPDFRETVFESLGLVAADDETISGRIPATITFADEDPLLVRLEGGKIAVSLRLKSLESDGTLFDGGAWTVRTSYTPVVGATETDVVRDAGIDVQPEDDPRAELVRSALARFLVEKASRGGLSVGDLARGPKLGLSQVVLEDGWCTLAWEQGSDSK